ncbi:OmpP1/FadL family transporter [Endozoicomonas sp. 8E]|uniref:OmpP1/FadL family transporter n=1 Tax=Endozoicomonas sp. 8E TaxID=3035692 RepID=UPI0029392931|nr:outer membrane protein transport protein [Endozoicomonas sp. 8E]WOG29232.1 TonB-dependent receptor [Endozoicomonas sp. 8E]
MKSHTRSSHFSLSPLAVASSLAVALSAGQAVAGGFEKATLWDAEYTALAGAAVSSVSDSSAIFFNPAGLAFAESNDIALHLSPTITQTSSPADGTNFTDGEKNFSPVGGFTGLFKLDDKFTMGYGIYASGGAAASYEDVKVGSALPVTADYSTDIKIIEAGLGLSYRINNNWSVGGTYRLTYATADINLASAPDAFGGAVGAAVGYNDLSGYNTFGVRLGAMYRSDDDRWGWGINYRSEVDIEADGDYNYRDGAGGSDTGDATAETALPMLISTGVDYKVAPHWTLFGEITYSKYSDIEKIDFSSDDTTVAVPAINTNWEDQYNYRVAAEYTGIENWALRAGYIYTTAVVPEEYAAPTFSSPADAHSFTLGAGTSILDGQVDLDFAAVYDTVKNDDVKGGGDLTSTTKSYAGKYESSSYSLHASATYRF